MIEINLARQIHEPSRNNQEVSRAVLFLGIVLLFVMGAVSWWWIQIKHQKLDFLLQEKNQQVQSLAEIQMSLLHLQRYQEEAMNLNSSLQVIQGQELSKKQLMVVLQGISRSIEGLDVWLDRIQMVDQIIELRGQSHSLQEIGKYIDALESQQVIISLPVIEVLDQQGSEQGKSYSFMIRFSLVPEVMA